MNIKFSYIIAFILSLAIVLWFVFADPKNNATSSKHKTNNTQLKSGQSTTDNNAEATDKVRQEPEQLPSVVIKTIQAKQHQSYLILHGQSEANREVKIKAETAGLVIDTPIREGSFVQTGDLICRQDVDARSAALEQAQALLKTRQLEYEAAKSLVKKGYRSETQLARAKAALDGARANVKRAEIELGNIEMRAPFSGIFERQLAETGDYLMPGQPCGLLVDLNPLVIVGEVTEKQLGNIKRGQRGKITLATGENVSGTIRLIDTKANPKTRTFRIELAVNNPNNKLKAGVTADIKLAIGKEKAHFIPAKVMTLNDAGLVGVKVLDRNNIVRFYPIKTIDEEQNGIWVAGLPDTVRLIIQGQDYVRTGIKVKIIEPDEVNNITDSETDK